MPPKTDRIQAIFQKAGASRAVTLVYGSQTVTGLSGGIDKDNIFEIQGYVEHYSRSVWVQADAFTADPVATKSITVDGVTHRILGVRPDGIRALIRLDLGARYGA